mgnify:CR=1 FL=1
MTLSERVSIAIAILNALTFIVMTVALIVQGRSLRQSRRDTELALLAVRTQSITTIMAYLSTTISGFNPKDGLEIQNKKQVFEEKLTMQILQLEKILEQIDKLEKEV